MTIKKAERLGVNDEVVGAGCHYSIPRFAVCIPNHWTSFQCAMHTRLRTPKIQPITKHHSKKKKAECTSNVLCIQGHTKQSGACHCCFHFFFVKVDLLRHVAYIIQQ